jgi:hypothetical protein
MAPPIDIGDTRRKAEVAPVPCLPALSHLLLPPQLAVLAGFAPVDPNGFRSL